MNALPGLLDRLTLTSDFGTHLDECLELVYENSTAYHRFVYRNKEEFLWIMRRLVAQGAIEIAPPFGQALLYGDELVGMIAYLSPADLRKCRLKAGLILRKTLLGDDQGLLGRLGLAAETLLKPRADDFYLSQLLIKDSYRRYGLGSYLLHRFEEEGRRRNCVRLVCETGAENNAALNCYLAQNYEIVDQKKVADASTGRFLHLIHMAKALAAR